MDQAMRGDGLEDYSMDETEDQVHKEEEANEDEVHEEEEAADLPEAPEEEEAPAKEEEAPMTEEEVQQALNDLDMQDDL